MHIGADTRIEIVGAPSTSRTTPLPDAKRLTDCRCINLRLPTRGGLYVWEFEKDK